MAKVEIELAEIERMRSLIKSYEQSVDELKLKLATFDRDRIKGRVHELAKSMFNATMKAVGEHVGIGYDDSIWSSVRFPHFHEWDPTRDDNKPLTATISTRVGKGFADYWVSVGVDVERTREQKKVDLGLPE